MSSSHNGEGVLGCGCMFLALVLLVMMVYDRCNETRGRKPPQECVDDLLPTAERIQRELEQQNHPLPPRILRSPVNSKSEILYREIYGQPGKEISDANSEYQRRLNEFFEEDQATVNAILGRGPLNDAALCLWDIAESKAASGRLVEARLAYLKVRRYGYALAMSGRTGRIGFTINTTRESIAANFSSNQLEFWSPAYEAAMQLIKRSGEIPCSGCGPGGIIQDVIAPVEDHFRDVHFPHLTAGITTPSHGQTLGPDFTVEGTVAEIPEDVYKDSDFWGRLLSKEEFDRLFQSQLYRLTSDAVTKPISPDLSLYVIAKVDSAKPYYISKKAVLDGKSWSADLSLKAGPEAPPLIAELIAVATYNDLPERFDDLPSTVWPVAWTRMKIN